MDSHPSSGPYSPLSQSDLFAVDDAVSLQGGIVGSDRQILYDAGAAPVPGKPVYRAKKTRIMRWLILHSSGDKQILTLDKRQVIQTLGLDIPTRDMRLLDSYLMSYGTMGQLLVRDNALVLSMEHVRMIITTDKVIIPIDDDKSDEKERFILYIEHLVNEHAANNMGLSPSSTICALRPAAPGSNHVSSEAGFGAPTGMDHEFIPFELHMLEAGLREICNHLSREVDHLQAQAGPALEELTRNADQPILERVRRIKTTHQRLTGRVKLVREVLERLMEDDQDMYRMCLHKQLQRKAAHQEPPSPEHIGSITAMSPGHMRPSMLGLHLRRHVSQSVNELQGTIETDEYHDLLDVENLLESYFMLIDSTHQSLMSIGEYIDDTEDLINIQLDYSRNKLIRFEILLTTGTFTLAFFSAVAGMLGENLVLPEAITQDIWGFVLINSFMLLCCIFAFVSIAATLKLNKLI